MALSIYLENGKVVVKSLATVNAAYDPAYFSPIQAKQYPTEGFLTATRVGTTNNLSITDANGKYIVYDLPYTEFKQKNGTTNIGSTVLATVSTLNGTSYFGFDVDFNSSISGIDTRVGGTETILTDVGKALRYDKNSGADPRGIYYDDLKGTSNSLVTIESARAIIQAGLVTQVNLYESSGLGYIDFSVLNGVGGSYTPVSIIGRPGSTGALQVNSGSVLSFSDGTYSSRVGLSSLTGNRNITVPDKDGVIALTTDITSSVWSTTGSDIYYNSGNVGIGISSLTEALEVDGNIFMSEGSYLKSETTDPTAGAQSQSLGFFLPYRSDGTTMAENRSGLLLGGAKFFEPRTTNGTILHAFNSLKISPTNSPDKAGYFNIGFGSASDTYPAVAVNFSSWASFGSTTDRHFKCYGYFGVRFESIGNQFASDGYSLGEWNGAGLGIGTNNPSAKLDVRGNSKLVGTVQIGDLASTGYLLPTADGTANQIVTTDGAGNTSWTSLPSLSAIDFDIANPPSLSDGRLAYDPDRETLVFQSEHGELAIGEGYKPVYNNTGSTIAKGATVKATGVSGEKFLIELFDASSGVDEELYFIGVTQAAINDQAAGIVVSEGYVKHLDTSSYSVGNILYASETAGALTTTKPTSPNLGIPVAMVTKVDGTNGTIYVRPEIYAHLDELHDVLLTSVAAGEVLKYDGTKWVNGTVSASGLSSTGDVTVQLDSDNNTSGSKFEILAGDGSTVFSIDENGVTEGLLTVATPDVTLGSSNYQVGSSGMAIIAGYTASTSYTADIYSAGGTNQNITVTNTNGLLTWTNPPIVASGFELRVYATKPGLLKSPVSVDVFNTTPSTTFQYWRFKAVASGTLADTYNYVYIENIGLFTSTSATGTEYPTTALTSPTSETGIVITSGYNYPSSSSYDEWKAFDGSSTSGWWSLGMSTNGYPASANWIQIELPSAINIQSVKLEFGNYMQTDTMLLYGSNTGAFSGEEVLVGTFTGLVAYGTHTFNI